MRLEECGEEPARAIGMAIEEAGIAPADVQYINYHGTSTELNDRIETRAVKLAFNGHAYKLAGSSLKSLIGHPQGACGAAGIAATLLAMRDGVLPPTINVDEPDPECDLDYVPDVGRKLQIEHAVANCIAFGSKNSAMLLRRVLKRVLRTNARILAGARVERPKTGGRSEENTRRSGPRKRNLPGDQLVKPTSSKDASVLERLQERRCCQRRAKCIRMCLHRALDRVPNSRRRA